MFSAMRAASGILPAGRAGRRLNAKDSLMVHWDRPTTSATSRHHRLQLPLLLEMVQNNSYKQQSGYMCKLLPGRSRPIEQLMNASSLYSMRIIGEQTSPLADDVQCSKIWQQATRSLQCQRHDAAGLPDCRRLIERGQPRPRELPRGVRHVWPGTDSRVEQSRSAGHELLLLSLGCCFAERRARSPAIQIHATDTRGHACDIVQSIHTGVLVRQRPEA